MACVCRFPMLHECMITCYGLFGTNFFDFYCKYIGSVFVNLLHSFLDTSRYLPNLTILQSLSRFIQFMFVLLFSSFIFISILAVKLEREKLLYFNFFFVLLSYKHKSFDLKLFYWSSFSECFRINSFN